MEEKEEKEKEEEEEEEENEKEEKGHPPPAFRLSLSQVPPPLFWQEKMRQQGEG
jgi:hypothetical protein